MSVELLHTLSLVSYIVAGVLFVAVIAMFFLLDVPKLYGDVSGRTARKAIEAIYQQNESGESNTYKPHFGNVERSKLTDKITRSGSLQSKTAGLPMNVGTEKLLNSGSYSQSDVTTILNEPANETTILEQPIGETTVLTNPDTAVKHSVGKFRMDVELSFFGSSEIIE